MNSTPTAGEIAAEAAWQLSIAHSIGNTIYTVRGNTILHKTGDLNLAAAKLCTLIQTNGTADLYLQVSVPNFMKVSAAQVEEELRKK